jgi:hypothetical protein
MGFHDFNSGCDVPAASMGHGATVEVRQSNVMGVDSSVGDWRKELPAMSRMLNR